MRTMTVLRPPSHDCKIPPGPRGATVEWRCPGCGMTWEVMYDLGTTYSARSITGPSRSWRRHETKRLQREIDGTP